MATMTMTRERTTVAEDLADLERHETHALMVRLGLREETLPAARRLAQAGYPGATDLVVELTRTLDSLRKVFPLISAVLDR